MLIQFFEEIRVDNFYLVTSTRTGASGSSSNTVTISLKKITNTDKRFVQPTIICMCSYKPSQLNLIIPICHHQFFLPVLGIGQELHTCSSKNH